jgi:hypothetical protein
MPGSPTGFREIRGREDTARGAVRGRFGSPFGFELSAPFSSNSCRRRGSEDLGKTAGGGTEIIRTEADEPKPVIATSSSAAVIDNPRPKDNGKEVEPDYRAPTTSC